jgi:TRAP transporter TAXI family solute receptor
MKTLRLTTCALAAAALMGVTLGAAGEAGAQGKKFISIGTGGPTGVYFVVGNSVCRMVHKEAAEGRKKGRKHGIRCAAPSTGGSTYNIGQICQGELEFGVAQSDWQHHAVNGSSERVTNCPGLRAVFSVHPEPFHLIAGDGSDIASFTDTKGKRMNIGNPGSGQRGTTEVLMEGYGITADDFAVATELTSTEQSQALCDGKIDAYGYTVGVPNAGVSVATDGCDAYIVNLTGEVEQKLVADNPFYAFNTIPAGTYKTTAEDVTTFGVMATFVSHESVPEDVVYEVTRAVMENLDDFRSLHPAFANLDPANMIKNGLSAPIHSGAAKYYAEQGWM